jgi:hypothetical protein
MNYHYDATGERVEDEDDHTPEPLPDLEAEYAPRSPEEIRVRCAELRRILRQIRHRKAQR